MNVKILITHSYFLRFDPKQWKLQQPYAPLGTLYAASILREKGMDIAFHDMMFARSPHELRAPLELHKPEYLVICDDGFNYLTKMCLTNMRDAAFEMMSMAKQYGCKVIVSGSDATDHSELYLQKGAHYIVVGEVEQTLTELIDTLNNGKAVSTVNGLRYLDSDKLIATQKRENLKDLDSLTFPAWDLINVDEYRNRWMNSSGYFSMNITTTRGCPFKCNWCAKPIYGNRYNSRSPENVVAELALLKSRYNFDHIWFCDDIFGLKPGWVAKFAELLHKEKLKIKFKIQSRVDLLLEENNIQSLHQAGCDEVWVGAESGSQKILDAMDKGTQVAQIYEATRLLKANKIKACFFLQFGYTGETKTDIDATLKMVLELMPDDIGISVSYPLPGTKFYDTVKAQLGSKANWTDSDELAMMFTSTYPSSFYKKLQRYVHSEYRKKKALLAWQHSGDVKKGLSLAYRIPQTLLSKAAMNKYVA